MQNNINNPKVLLDMNDSWFNVPSDGAETFIVNHDNERGSAGTSYLNYKNSPRYSIAQSFLVAWPFIPVINSASTIQQVRSVMQDVPAAGTANTVYQ